MSSVLVDNWLLQQAFLNNDRDAWSKLLNAIVLWDEVWFFSGNTSDVWLSQLSPSEKRIVEQFLFPIGYNTDYHDTLEYLKDCFHALTLHKYHYDNISDRTIYYGLLSNYLGVQLLVAKEREQAVLSYRKCFTRDMLTRHLDEEYREYIDSNLLLEEKQAGYFSAPLLDKYISDQACSRFDELKVAHELNSDPDVVALRDSIDRIEESFIGSDLRKRTAIFEEITDLAQKINQQYSGSNRAGITYSVNLTPSFHALSSGADNPQDPMQSLLSCLSFSIYGNLKPGKKKRLHTVFLESVYRNGFHMNQGSPLVEHEK